MNAIDQFISQITEGMCPEANCPRLGRTECSMCHEKFCAEHITSIRHPSGLIEDACFPCAEDFDSYDERDSAQWHYSHPGE